MFATATHCPYCALQFGMSLRRNATGVVVALTRERVIELLSLRAVDEYRRAVWSTPVPPGRRRAARASAAAHLPGRRRLSPSPGWPVRRRRGIFHEPDCAGDAERDLAIATRGVFIEPLARLLRDGIADGIVTPLADVDQTATVLFNQVGWTYLALRVGQRWDASRAENAVVALAIAAVVDRSANCSNGANNRC